VAERAAALTALLALAAALVILVTGVVLSWAWAALAVVALAAAVTSGWYAVSRRGAARGFALAAAAVALALFAAALVLADLRPLRITAAVLLAAVSVGCARWALRRSPTASPAPAASPAVLPAGDGHAGRGGRPLHPALIMNLKSGGGKAERYHLVQECTRRGIEPIVLRPGDDLLRLAEDAIGAGADVIGMAGGDGSQALVATVAARHHIPYVVIPAGTRNHFALDLGLDRDDVVGALDAFADGTERRIDLAEVNGRVFVNNASLGLYAKVVASPEYRDAKLKTAAGLLPELLGPGAQPLDLRFTGPGGTEFSTAHLILVSNGPYQLDHIGGRGTRERLDAGTLGVVAARIGDAAAARRFAALEAAGQIRRFEGWHEWETGRFEVGSGGPVQIGIDGETLVMDPPLVFTTRPGALRVRLPGSAAGRSPAATALRLTSRGTLTNLALLAAGRPAE
jgi:diacylglycerol kinase family enzyme